MWGYIVVVLPKRLTSVLVGVLLLAISLGVLGWTARAYARRDGAATPVATPVVIATPVATPDPRLASLQLTAKSAILINADSGTVLYAKDADTPRAPGSTAKIVTALTVLRYAKPEEIVTIQPDEVVDASESNMGLRAGDTITVHDLLVGMLLPSGNDAARVLARVIGERLPGDGSPVQRFVAEENTVAQQLGMNGNHIVDPAGDDAPDQEVTARGLALAARELLTQPTLLAIVSMPSAEVKVGGPNARTIQLTTTNDLLATEGVFGIKTGTTPLAGECLVAAYHARTGVEIAVVLGSDDRYVDARALLGLPAAK